MRLGKLKSHVIATFLTGEVRQVTAILSPVIVLRLTHKTIKGKKDRRNKVVEGNIHLGRPNYAERQVINKMCAKDFPRVTYRDFK